MGCLDEIHSFIGTDRGTQLKSLLSRLKDINQKKFNVIGLSATIGDYAEAKRFTGDETGTKVLLDRTAKEINARFRFFESATDELPPALLKDLYLETKNNRALIFPNSRGRVEEVAVKLRKISERTGGHSNYFSHHSSVHKEVREYVEFFAKNNNRRNFSISCTSTLELGIDIGTVDKIIQIDSAHSVSSLVQRVGRSGRKDGQSSNLFLYATDEWNLLQSLACWKLHKEGFIEPPQTTEKPFDILLHQALSITKGQSGIGLSDLIEQLKENFAFRQIARADIEEIFNRLIEIDFLEKLHNEVIIGIEGEKVVNSRDFYSMFTTEINFKVVGSGNIIGEIPFSPQIKENENIFLAARIWKIIAVDFSSNTIEATPARDGKKPKFNGSGSLVHPKIREKMFEILFGDEVFECLDQKSLDEIARMRKDFSVFRVTNFKLERPLLINESGLNFFTFSGTRINRTIAFLLKLAGTEFTLHENSSSIEIDASRDEFLKTCGSLPDLSADIDAHVENLLQTTPGVLGFSKWGLYLPLKFQVKLIKEKYFDFSGAERLLTARAVSNSVND